MTEPDDPFVVIGSGHYDADDDSLNLALQCIDYYKSRCTGEVQYRYPLSGTGRSFPRCDVHWGERLDREAVISERYPSRQPDDFDPTYAGESWYEDE